MNENKEKLKIGILLDTFIVPSWVYQIFELLTKSPFLTIDLIILNNETKNQTISKTTLAGKNEYLLYRFFRKFDSRFASSSPHVDTNSENLLEGIPILNVTPIRTKFSDKINENFVEIKKKNKKKSIRRYWIECNEKLLLFTDLHSKKKLSGIYELPLELPESITYDPKAHEPLGIRKRTIGNVDYQEEIIRITNFESKNDELENGYIWANREKIEKLTLSGPHRKWIEEILAAAPASSKIAFMRWTSL